MAIHYKDPQTGRYVPIKIPVMKGDRGYQGIHVGTDEPPTTEIKLWFDPSENTLEEEMASLLGQIVEAQTDARGVAHRTLKEAMDANVAYVTQTLSLEALVMDFNTDYRLMEIEAAVGIPMTLSVKGGKGVALSPYEMAKKLILADNYERQDMENKLKMYVKRGRMTEEERQELLHLMDVQEGLIVETPEEEIEFDQPTTIPLD